jgi:hypothetical protein
MMDYLRCPRRYFFKKCGLVPTDLESPAPIFGNAMHRAIPLALATEDFDLAYAAFMDEWEEFEQEMLEDRGELDPKKNSTVAKRILKHFIHTRKEGKCLYKLVKPDFDPIVEADVRSDFEVPWMIDIGLRVPLVGRFDGFCKHRDTGDDYIFELKTTARLTNSFFEAHEMYCQNITYMLVGCTLMGRDLKGVMLEGVLTDAKKVDNQTHVLPIKQHHLQDILTLYQREGGRLLEMEELAMDLAKSGGDPAEAFHKNFAGCTPYTHHYIPTTFRCEYALMCGEDDWRVAANFYHIKEEHDFLKVTIEGDAS